MRERWLKRVEVEEVVEQARAKNTSGSVRAIPPQAPFHTGIHCGSAGTGPASLLLLGECHGAGNSAGNSARVAAAAAADSYHGGFVPVKNPSH